jgi:hypothetical protein
VPYGKSILGSCGLIVVVMLVLGLLADPASREIRSPALAWSLLAVLPAAIAALFYAEFRLRNKRAARSRRQPGMAQFAGSRKC